MEAELSQYHRQQLPVLKIPLQPLLKVFFLREKCGGGGGGRRDISFITRF